ncbi:MAG: SDR family oxidoreductase [Peptococcaceae bacterium]|nr:SDR family oxidoreductase [Peptococcaceae bacterium]
MGEFSGRVAVITAAAGAGIGQAVARSLAREGAFVVISDAHAKRPYSVAEEIMKEYGTRAVGVQCDVRNRVQVEEMVDLAVKEWGRIDILVNNAGIDRPAPVWEMDDETWDLVIDVNLKGAFNCCRAVLPVMIKQGRGRIINLSSVVAWMGGKDEGAAYVAAKAGIQGLTRAVASQVGEYNITVNAVAPGLAYNPFLGKVRPPEYFEEVKKHIPLGRMGAPQDIANAVLFLCSDRADYITGSCLCVSGGWYMY